MKALIRFLIPGILVLALLAGCSFNATPRNFPRGTIPPGTTGTSGTPGIPGTASPLVVGTSVPTLVTGTPPATANALPTQSAPTAVQPTAAAATSTPEPSAGNSTPVVPNTGGNSQLPGSIAIPAQVQDIQFPNGATSYVVTSNLQANKAQAYRLNAKNGQRFYITIDGDAAMQIYDPNQHALSGVLTAVNPVRISLSQNGNYTIALMGQGPVTMSVYIPPTNGNQDVAAPIPAQIHPVQFQAGATSATLTPTLTNGTPVGYTINAKAGQTLTVTTNGNATVTLLGPDVSTTIPSNPAPTHQWIFPLTQGGNYTLVVFGNGAVNLQLSIPASASGNTGGTGAQPTAMPVPANPSRVTIAQGNASTTVNANLAAGKPQAYLINVQAGQTLYISTTNAVNVTVYGPNKNVLVNGHSDFPNLWSTPAAQTGDYTLVISGSGASTLTFYVPPK